MPNIVIGVDQGSYSVSNGTREITLSGLSFTPTLESLLYLFNTTQDKQYFAQGESYAKEITITPSGNNYILTYQDIFPELATGDKMHIQFWTEGADYIPTNGYTGIVAIAPGHVSLVNSTIETLDPDATFTGGWEDITNFGVIVISLTSNVSSAIDGLMVQFSSDGTMAGIISDDEFTYSAGAKKTFSFQAAAKFYRVVYTNGITIQASFNLQVVLKPYYVKPSSHRIQDSIINDDDAELVKAVLTGENPGGTFVNFQSTTAGNFKVSIEELENDVSTNNNTQLNTSPYIVDEYGNYNHQLGDNGFKGAIIAIPPEHHEIHCGDSYTAHHVADLANAATIDYVIITPNWGDPVVGNDPMGNQAIKVAHLIGELNGQAETQVWFYESPTVSANGNLLNILNRNRNSSNVDFLSIYEGATISAVGTELEHSQFGAGKAVGGGVNRTDEWVLANNTTYLMRVTNNTTSNNYHSIRFQYYVHPGI